jgi:hypothetical protein
LGHAARRSETKAVRTAAAAAATNGKDELRATLFSAVLRRLLAEALQDGEQVVWQGQPDGIARAAIWRFL